MSSLSGIARILEVGLIACHGFAIFMMLSLVTFHPADPSWTQTAWEGSISNSGGSAGAWLADISLFIFGITAYLLPFVIVGVAWFLFWKPKGLFKLDYLALGLRVIGFLFLVLGFTALASLNFDDIYYFSSGGVLGDILSRAMVEYFGLLGSTLVLLCFIATGFTLLTGLSWLMLIDKLGEWIIHSALFLVNLPQKIQQARARKDEPQGADKILFSEQLPEAESTMKAPEDKPKLPSLEKVFDENIQLNQGNVTDAELADGLPAFSAHYEHSDELDNQANVMDVPWLDEDAAGHMDVVAEDNLESHIESVQKSVAAKGQFDKAGQQNPPEEKQAPSVGDIHQLTPEVTPHSPVTPVATTDLPAATAAHDGQDLTPEDPAIFPAHSSLDTNDDARQENATPPAVAQLVNPNSNTPSLEEAIKAVEAKKNLPPLAPLPSIDLLDRPNKAENPISQEELDQVSRLVEAKLLDFNVQAQVVAVFPGPVITRFELDLAPGIKVSKITGLSKDLARALSAMSVRVVEVIPGKSYIGLELPNRHRETVFLREVLDCQAFQSNASPLSMVLGSDIAGKPVVVDLAKMPHLLVAGTTGSGKSVGVNCMIVSLLYKSSPEDVRMIMIDPKMLELSVYEGIPHLLSEVVTDMKEAANALRWCVGEMERRYKLMSAVGVRNLKGYNAKVEAGIEAGTPLCDPLWKPGDSMDETAPELEKLPHIVVVVDEFADMMMIVGKKVEELIARIAQKARAAGIHLILATQRPSVDVITGLIKANIPTRIAFQVSSKIDSRTILDQQGAESLLGMGDMLYMPPGTSVPTRVHGAFVDDHEVHKVVADWKLRGEPNYIEDILNGEPTAENMLPGEVAEADEEMDAFYDEAVAFVTETRRGSVSGVQRKFKIGYNRAARIVEQMELQGIVSAPGHNGNREVLAPPPPPRN
ncbi:DUF87 domain-containing protein [Motilimonas pumila]|uniref:DNA translocase FtsK n=1 Tax=Motilimonas pumila TaxID=2303987 RepID=A0A418YGF7_9GAMM|nr:DNA translocase FtsK 4TM domain-containing protein [Motilimonas pumila]RJG48749.1 DUF87 domain-containing protein [Motilimonas pumila]